MTTWQELKQRATDQHEASMQLAYEKGYADASNEILVEVIGALKARRDTADEGNTAGLDVAIAVVAQLQ